MTTAREPLSSYHLTLLRLVDPRPVHPARDKIPHRLRQSGGRPCCLVVRGDSPPCGSANGDRIPSLPLGGHCNDTLYADALALENAAATLAFLDTRPASRSRGAA